MYDQYYGLSGRPFQLTPDPGFYFESGTHRKALSYLGYGLAQGEGFIVITGEVGAGKSTLVSHLMQTIDKARLTAASIVTSNLDGLDMVHMAARSFGMETQGLDKSATLKAIESFLHSEARAGRRCLLIVDEAQNLGIDALEELRMLSNFQLGSQALLQIFLLGQPEFRDMVQSAPELEQLRQRVIATHHLEAMEADEVEPYIVHRLSKTGWTGRPRFEAEAIAAIYAETQGVPRKLNTLMNRVLLMGAIEQIEVIDADLVDAVIADMAGKPFEYEAPLSAKAPVVEAASFDEEATVHDVPTFVAGVEEVLVDAESEKQAEALTETVVPIIAVSSVIAEAPSEIAALPNADETGTLASKVSALEKRVSEQDAALRRVLAMLIDWMDKEQVAFDRHVPNIRAA
jgi:general secretion pathway protein A